MRLFLAGTLLAAILGLVFLSILMDALNIGAGSDSRAPAGPEPAVNSNGLPPLAPASVQSASGSIPAPPASTTFRGPSGPPRVIGPAEPPPAD